MMGRSHLGSIIRTYLPTAAGRMGRIHRRPQEVFARRKEKRPASRLAIVEVETS
jgi:hypothetical protein